ncbi:DEAD/DEAH box helicase ['Fragaria x ananassa' phyllody phytoplasma]|uniref:primosomal protein N' family DNA-binding protein n=1 Tax='Fragaria x ananassa' phyllody phytoplasma TaxID=2358428 RepID=UPI001CEC08A8|nr:DEAD/DEAH box helicase ['Fragaria x ananassa' phyllody phytoplasma]
MIAQVIIELPTSALNHYFDYLVPEKFIPLAKKGVRVIVSFGKNNSQHLGYIVNITNKSIFANKYLISVLDEQPYFNEELFLLAEEMLKTPFVLKTLVYNTIIPKEFLITYLKEITIIKRALIPKNIQTLIPQQNKFLLNTNNKILQELQKLSQKGILKIQNILKTTKKVKTNICYNLNPKIKSLSQLNLTPKQKDFILKLSSLQQYLNHNQSVPLHKITILRKEALLLTSSNIINKLLQQEILLKSTKKIDIFLKHHFKPLEENKKIILNEEQKKILQQINLKKYQTYLLHGKTSSGKTEIYLNLIAKILKQKKQVLFLVPEVMLIAPLIQRLKSKFTMTEIAVLHSYLTPLQKQDQFNKIKNQKVQIVLGTRSAIFAPLNYLGIIIINEEHDESLLEKKVSL